MATKKSQKEELKKTNYPVVIYDPSQAKTVDSGVSMDTSPEPENYYENNGTTFPIVAITPSIKVYGSDKAFPYVNTRKPNKPYKNVLDLLSDFEFDLTQIQNLAKTISEVDGFFQKKEQARAVFALSKILGIYQKYFKGITESRYDSLMLHLRMKCKVARNSKTTPLHLLSRQYRNNDTKQASSDAKILILADSLGKDEHNFATWIIEYGGLNKVKESSIEHAKLRADKIDTEPYKMATPAKQKALFRRMEESVARVAKAQQTKGVFSINKSKLPKMFDTLKPHSGCYWRVLVVKVEEGVDDEGYQDDELHFHALYSTVPENARLYKGNRLDLKGTSDSTWPEWMLKKPEEPEKPEESEEPVESEKPAE